MLLVIGTGGQLKEYVFKVWNLYFTVSKRGRKHGLYYFVEHSTHLVILSK